MRLYDSLLNHHQCPKVVDQASVNTQLPTADDKNGFSENLDPINVLKMFSMSSTNTYKSIH